MSVFKRLSLLSAAALVTLATVYTQAGGAQQTGNHRPAASADGPTNRSPATQLPRLLLRTVSGRRRGAAGERTDLEAPDSKVKFRYGYYPY